MRLDAYLAYQVMTTTRALAAEAIRAGRVQVNGLSAAKGDKLAAGDRIDVAELLEAGDWKAAPDPSVRLVVLHEDSRFLAVEKPSGVPVHPLQPGEPGTLVGGLLAVHPELADVGPDPLFPAVVHRLDTETSGVMLVARDAETYAQLRGEFRARRIEKRYLALVSGRVAGVGRQEHVLAHSERGPHRMVAVERDRTRPGRRPLRAVTEYDVRERLPRHTLLDVVIRTGVTHQIRCQLALAGHPVAGDRLYGKAAARAGYRGRLFLHAGEILFRHPETGVPVRIRSPLPPDLRRALATLRGGQNPLARKDRVL